MTTPLSPAAQAVQAAVVAAFWDQHRDLSASPAVVAAATARALVSALGTRTRGGAIILSGDAVLDLAAELEGADV